MTWFGEKTDLQPPQSAQIPQPSPPVQRPRPAEPAPPQAAPPVATATRGASIGKSIHVKGQLTGSEDLAIEGKVEGTITLTGCRVTIGANGQVVAEIAAKSVLIGGQVKGSVRADERVEIAATGSLVGDVRAPRLVLADGARFKGSVDMDVTSAAPSAAPSAPATSSHESLLVLDELYVGAKDGTSR
jgi:cytoskeletal protein CcmA (bactofilin family)